MKDLKTRAHFDPDMLHMENELLTYENQYLRGRYREIEHLQVLVQEAKREAENARRQAEGERRWREIAERHVVGLLRRLWRSPLTPVLRLNKNFRKLVQLYLFKQPNRNTK